MKCIECCGICKGTSFHEIWDLPQFPLTERFGKYSPEKKLAYDQKLLMCAECGHVQLGYQLSPEILYTSTEYSFRTSASASARSGVAFFLNFLQSIVKERLFRSLVDVGGNDLYLAQLLKDKVAERTVIDPICSSTDGQKIDGIRVYGRFIENVDLKKDLLPPDLVACRHTLEHIANPRDVLLQLFEQCAPDCLYFFEIPCFENLVEGMRFDAVFHQHYHYYDLPVFKRLLWETGGEYIAHAYNHQGSCGGALVIAFRKALHKQEKPFLDIPTRLNFIKSRLQDFLQMMSVQSRLLAALPGKVFGFGASLMLVTLAYHLKTDLSKLTCILDDDSNKEGMTYENLPVTVRHPQYLTPPQDACYLITSLENARPIFKRIQEFKPRRVLTPIIS
jgi:cyclopropane-fatty-acyl-phospholipid synthase